MTVNKIFSKTFQQLINIFKYIWTILKNAPNLKTFVQICVKFLYKFQSNQKITQQNVHYLQQLGKEIRRIHPVIDEKTEKINKILADCTVLLVEANQQKSQIESKQSAFKADVEKLHQSVVNEMAFAQFMRSECTFLRQLKSQIRQMKSSLLRNYLRI